MASVNSAVLCNVGLRIREERLKHKMTQSELAHAIGSNKSRISNIEIGQTIPSIETLIKIGDAMGISINDFIVTDPPYQRKQEESGVYDFFQEIAKRILRLNRDKQAIFMATVESILKLTIE